MARLKTKIESVTNVSTDLRNEMFILYQTYYDGTNKEIFEADLLKKDYVLCLYDGNSLKGFSTLALISTEFQNKPIRVIFSGDTIVDHRYWGQQELAISWLQFCGEIKRQEFDVPLYWLLIVKGHRTYRYLSVFSNDYYPAHDKDIPLEMRALRDELAKKQFGEAYLPEKGIVHFSESRGHLRKEFAYPLEKDQKKKDVNYFFACNPSFDKGDELVCICELSSENMKPLARRNFGVA